MSISGKGSALTGKILRDAWFTRIKEYKAKYPELADQLYRMQHRQLPDGWDKDLPAFPADAEGHGNAGLIRKGIERAGKARALVDGRVGGSGPFGQNTVDV